MDCVAAQSGQTLMPVKISSTPAWQTPLMQFPTLPKPRLPAPSRVLGLPLRLIPGRIHSGGLSLILNQLFAEALRYRQLDFLEGRVLRVQVLDLGLDYRLTLEHGRLTGADPARPADVTFGGNLYELALLALNREDPDTLFFQRRLQLSGDTELGLEIKNFLYTLDEELLPPTLRRAMEKVLSLLPEERLAAQSH